MKQSLSKLFIITFFSVSLLGTACKSKNADANATNIDTTSTSLTPQPDNTTVKPDTATAVTISPDDSLVTMAKDAVKDYPGVTATVNNGELTLTGNIKRAQLPKLMAAVSALHPKKVNNNLTINK